MILLFVVSDLRQERPKVAKIGPGCTLKPASSQGRDAMSDPEYAVGAN